MWRFRAWKISFFLWGNETERLGTGFIEAAMFRRKKATVWEYISQVCELASLIPLNNTRSGASWWTNKKDDMAAVLKMYVDPYLVRPIDKAICSGDSLFLQGVYQTVNGTYYDTLPTTGYCYDIWATTLSVDSFHFFYFLFELFVDLLIRAIRFALWQQAIE